MIIEDSDTFRAWLTEKLEPLCDADPAALAKYVYALVKKEKPIEELRTSMLQQLEVFLQSETHGFVDCLFQKLQTIKPVNESNELLEVAKTDFDFRENIELDKKKETAAPVIATQNSNSITSGILNVVVGRPKESDRHSRKGESDKEERSRRFRRRGSSASTDRRRSRSRSNDRRRSRSRDRDRGRAWRNKSPPSRRYERRRSYSKSPRKYSKSRSPPSKRTRYRNRSPPRSRSRSPIDNWERKDGSPRDGNHGDTDLRSVQSVVVSTDKRCRDFHEKGYCMRGDQCPYDHGSDPVIVDDLPMFKGGPPQQPLLLSQAPVPPHQLPPRLPPPLNMNIVEYNPSAPSILNEPRMWRPQHPFRGGPMMRGMMRGGMGRGGFQPHMHQRELINVVTGGPHFRHHRPTAPENTNGRMDDSKPGFDYGRLGSHRGSPNYNGKNNTTLQLKKVPVGTNNITHLNNHFAKFGKIINIQVGFEGDPESALITFSSPVEANIAYKSTEAVLNNRFIRVFWYNPSINEENIPPTPRPSVLERLGAPPSKVLNNIQPSAVQLPEEKVTMVNNNLSKTLYIPSAMKKEIKPVVTETKEIEKQELKKKIEEVSVAKKKQEEARLAGIQLNKDLRRRKQELLEKQLNQQKLLIQRMEDPTISQQQKGTIMETIKTLQGTIEKIKKDLESSVKVSSTKSPKKPATPKENLDRVKKSKEELQRELLDAELDLITKENEGKDSEELRKKLSELKMKAFNLGMISRGGPRGRSIIRARGRGRGSTKFVANSSFDHHNVVDHRPTKLLVSGYEQDDKSEVITHFSQYGEIIDYISDDTIPSLVLNYKQRKEAEVALTKGRNFHDRLLSVTWASHNNNLRSGVISKPATPIRSVIMMEEDEENDEAVLDYKTDGIDDDYGALSPEFILQEDEEDEDEERSWRR